MVIARPYQRDLCANVLDHIERRDGTNLLVQAATGLGKTVIAALAIKQLEALKRRTFFFAHRQELIYQTHAKLAELGVDAGIIMAGEKQKYHARTQVASIDTLRSWLERGKITYLEADAIFIDETHRALSPTYQQLIDHYNRRYVPVVGLTATPIRSDGRGMAQTFDHMVCGPSVREAIENGWLVQPKHYAAFAPDLSGVRITGGDFDEEQLQEIMDQKHLVGDVIDNYIKHAMGRQAICFGSGVRHSMHLRDEFNLRGIPAAHIDAHTSKYDRQQIIRDYRSGAVRILCNCAIFTEGYDAPETGAIIDAQPTKSLGKYIQKGGRGLRSHPGKADCIILDHAGAFYSHGRLDAPIEWELVHGAEVVEKQAERKAKERAAFTCGECQYVFSGSQWCPECGAKMVRTGKYAEYLPAELVPLTQEEYDAIAHKPARSEKRSWYQQLVGLAREKGYSDGWVRNQYRDKWGDYPPRKASRLGPVEVTPEVRSWVRGKQLHHIIREKKKAAKQKLEGATNG